MPLEIASHSKSGKYEAFEGVKLELPAGGGGGTLSVRDYKLVYVQDPGDNETRYKTLIRNMQTGEMYERVIPKNDMETINLQVPESQYGDFGVLTDDIYITLRRK